MKIISFDDIKQLNISPVDCYEWVDDMIAHKKESILPAKIHMSLPGNIFTNVMSSVVPASVTGLDWSACGVKIVSRYPERIPSMDSKILLQNADSGEVLALMDGNWITAMRTGAVAAHSALLLARSGWDTVGMIGLGNTARATMLMLAHKIGRPLKVKLLRYKDQAESFIERFKDYPELGFTIVDTYEECIRGSHVIVSSVTYFPDDIGRDEWYDEGVLAIPIHTRGFTNCDLFFDKVFADDTGHVCDFRYFSKYKYYAEVADVVTGSKEGRVNDRERILAYNIGVSVHDIYYAARIYDMLTETGRINEIGDASLQDPTDKFWV